MSPPTAESDADTTRQPTLRESADTSTYVAETSSMGAATISTAPQAQQHTTETSSGQATSDVIPGRDRPPSTGLQLPKLTMPSFAGDPLEWQSFCDTFESAVHNNSVITDVQKFTYLRAQLDGAAAQCIAGFTPTHANYAQALALLRDRFGRDHIVINAHIHALLALPSPQANGPSLRGFYDAVECHIRGLLALGKSTDSFGDFLVPVIMDKLPAAVTAAITRTHGSSSCN